MKKIALLWLTIREPLHAELWKEMLTPHLNKFNIYIHSKFPLTDSFFQQFAIPTTVETSWAVNAAAQRLLLEAAYPNPDNYKFIYLSDGCIPLYPLSQIYEKFTINNSSYLHHGSPWWGDSIRIPDSVPIPKEYHWGSSQWMILNRYHALLVVSDDRYSKLIIGTHIDNESYPATLFKIKGVLTEFQPGMTYADWSRSENGHPFTFRTPEDLPVGKWKEIRREGFYFIRKIGEEMPAVYLKELMSLP